MDPASEVRERAFRLMQEDEPEAVGKGAELLKTAADIDQIDATISKLQAERKKIEHDLSQSRTQWKDLLTAASPILATSVLAGTLVFQIYSTRKSDQEKQEEVLSQARAAEQARFTDALKLIQASENISPAATLLNTFTSEPQKTEARRMAVKLLLRATSIEDFRDLFSSTIEPVTSADLVTLVQLNKSITAKYTPLGAMAYKNGIKEDTSRMDKKTKQEYDLLGDELELLSQKTASILRGPRTGGSEIDLSATTIDVADMKGADLRHANLSGANFFRTNLDGCDLSEITNFSSATFYSTPWWHAARISKPLLNYLEENASFEKSFHFGGIDESPSPANPDEYSRNLARLKSTAAP